MSTRWASGAPRIRVRAPQPARPPEPGQRSAPAGQLSLAGRAGAISAEWAPTAGRILLGVLRY